MTLGLYGGSFNPPHTGHVGAAAEAIKTLRLDRLIWMPSGDPPHKTLPEETPSPAHRLAMSRLAAAGLRGAEVSAFELDGGARYTVDTVRMLLEREKPEKLYLLMGSDQWEVFPTWRQADELLKLCEPYIFPRTPVSSTEIRAQLREGRGKELLTPGVYDYIRSEGLYGNP
ncbi:MAG: nicotinate-nicotinamide nucleotide adenylyltransferase [Oscillospiraceae bacterium]|jgi:nicotinate-nucleotide adenylyltransferase|nr:nicotinate-nicotinamide nucleotide adenylyltransferase [Oscillospiraceae bacterium]